MPTNYDLITSKMNELTSLFTRMDDDFDLIDSVPESLRALDDP